MTYQYFAVNIENHIAQVVFDRPDKANALNEKGWEELKAVFEEMDERNDVRVIVLSGAGKHFCAGIDLTVLMSTQNMGNSDCEGRKRESIRKFITKLQDCINAIEHCRKPVLAAVHNGCIGGAVDIVTACDMRYATQDAYFTVKEIDMGMVADLGTLQRLPKIIAPGLAAEIAFTGRKVMGEEAAQIGLANRAYADKDSMMAAVLEIAATIASKSPLSIRGTKDILLHSRDNTVADGLKYMSAYNAGMLISNDLMEAFQASMQKRAGVFKEE